MLIARHCSGGVILGFEQYRSLTGIRKPEAPEEQRQGAPVSIPTPWNHLEAGVLFGLRLPILIFREHAIEGGVFDPGASDVFIHEMPAPTDTKARKEALSDVFLKWQAEVRRHYGFVAGRPHRGDLETAALEPLLLRRGPLRGWERLEPLVGNRLATLERHAVCPRSQSLLRSLDGGELIAKIGLQTLVELVLIEVGRQVRRVGVVGRLAVAPALHP